jgi:hypothetical protein
MTQRLVLEDSIAVLPSHPFPFNKSAFFQVLNDSLNSPLSDADFDGNLAKHFLRVGVKDREDVCVISEKRPTGSRLPVVTFCSPGPAFLRCALFWFHPDISFGKT